ncbi:unnamed protein product [Chrysoparadoxa australica]
MRRILSLVCTVSCAHAFVRTPALGNRLRSSCAPVMSVGGKTIPMPSYAPPSLAPSTLISLLLLAFTPSFSSAEGLVQELFTMVGGSIEFRDSDHAEACGFDKWSNGDCSGTVQGRLASTKVDWCNVACTKAGETTKSSLQAWCMPMFDVPHLLVDVTTTGDEMLLELDIVAKDDLMYPAADYLANYYGEKTQAWYNKVVENPLASVGPAPATVVGRILGSPVRVSVKLDGNNPEATSFAQGAINELAELWLGWLEDATEIPRVRRGTMLGRDTAIRRSYFALLGQDPLLGDSDNAKLVAAAMVGPGDAAYTGQAS